MGTPVKKWVEGSVAIAVERGRDAMKQELRAGGPHAHVYKNGKRTDSRIPGKNKDVDAKDYRIAEKLFDKYYYDIKRECEKVAAGEYGE